MSAPAPSWQASFKSKRVSKRKFLVGAAAGMGAAALVACGGSTQKVDTLTISSDASRQPGAVIYSRDYWKLADETAEAIPGGIYPGQVSDDAFGQGGRGFDPVYDGGGAVRSAAGYAYEFLVARKAGPGVEPGSPESRTFEGQLAEAWEVSSDAMKYVFTLRPGVKFHNISPVSGREMTIDDWRTSAARFAALSPYRSVLADFVDRYEYPDARHMVMYMKFPYALLPVRLTGSQEAWRVLPRELNDDPDIAAEKMIGTNFRVLDKWQPSLTQEWKRHESYWQGKPLIARWHYPLIPEYANRYAQFMAKHVISFSPTGADALKVRREAPESVMVGGEISKTSFQRMNIGRFDAQTSPWQDERIRIALRRAVDWEGVTAVSTNAAEFKAAGIDMETSMATHMPYDPDFWLDPRQGQLGTASANYLYDLAEARKLASAAGYPNGFEMDQYAYPTNAEKVKLVNDQYNRSGFIKMNYVLVDSAKWSADISSTFAFKGIMGPHVVGGTDVDFMLYRYFHTDAGNTAFPDPKLNEIIDAQRRAIDPNRRVEILKDFQRYMSTRFYLVPGDGIAGSWSFQWPWLHNINQPGQLQWLDKNMPNRDG